MRKLLLSVLLAGVAAGPAFADPGDGGNNRDNNRAERAQARSERAEARSERQESRAERRQLNVERSGPAATNSFTGNPSAMQERNQVRRERVDARARAFGGAQASEADIERVRAAREAQLEANQQGGDQSRNWRDRRGSTSSGTLVQPNNQVPNVMQPRHRTPVVSDVPRQGTQPPLRVDNRRWSHSDNWNRNWRNDHRYDWQDWRRRHRSLFRIGFYYDPFGWGYQPYSIGWRLWPNYYRSNYWINDPWQYRLPYAPPGTRWIRYYDDALLVDTFTGQVVDVIYNFFW